MHLQYEGVPNLAEGLRRGTSRNILKMIMPLLFVGSFTPFYLSAMHLKQYSFQDPMDELGVLCRTDNCAKSIRKSGLATTRIDGDFPSEELIKTILTKEQKLLVNSTTLDIVDDLANLYELAYAFIAAFQRNDIPIFAGFGSHLGARRHHAVIPFGEKDVDFQVFSLDEDRVLSIIKEVLQSKYFWSNITISDHDFGFQLGEETMMKNSFRHYIDFWLFDDKYEGNKIRCTGRPIKGPKKRRGDKNGCEKWYRDFRAKPQPTFVRSDYFPPVYQVFGSHKVPIPAKSTELETFQYSGSTEHWNTTCGTHRPWDFKLKKWVQIPKEKRKCAPFYDDYPFVFKVGNFTEELRQGGVVIHRSNLVEGDRD